MSIFLPNWLGITIGRDIISWRPLDTRETRHELTHVIQWHANGAMFIPRYIASSWRAHKTGIHWYWGNEFEEEARAAAAFREKP